MKCRVLIAEDEKDIRDVMAEFLAEEGYLIMTACNGLEALQSAIQHRPNIILLDHRMPGMEGLDVARSLVDRGASAHIIVISAAKDIRDPALALGCGFIAKPYDLDTLLTHLSAACRGVDS